MQDKKHLQLKDMDHQGEQVCNNSRTNPLRKALGTLSQVPSMFFQRYQDPLNFLATKIAKMPHAKAPIEYGKSVKSALFGSSFTVITIIARMTANAAIVAMIK